MATDDPLRLMALDEADLEVLSAHLQDAVVKVEDISLRAGEHRVILAVNRFAWEAGGSGRGRRRTWQRRRAALRFDRVSAMRSTGIDRDKPDAVLSILTIAYEPAQAPAGRIELVFAGGAALQLDVECIEAQVTDLGAAWTTRSRPRHGTG